MDWVDEEGSGAFGLIFFCWGGIHITHYTSDIGGKGRGSGIRSKVFRRTSGLSANIFNFFTKQCCLHIFLNA